MTEELLREGWLPPHEVVNTSLEAIGAALTKMHLVVTPQEALDALSAAMLATPMVPCTRCGHGPFLHDPEKGCIGLLARKGLFGLNDSCGCRNHYTINKKGVL